MLILIESELRYASKRTLFTSSNTTAHLKNYSTTIR